MWCRCISYLYMIYLSVPIHLIYCSELFSTFTQFAYDVTMMEVGENSIRQNPSERQCVCIRRVSLVLTCTFHLEKFPMDNQTCWVKMESCKYHTKVSQ